MVKRYRPVVEQLEDRLAPASFGIPWPNPNHLTISFVPDGTVGGVAASNLFQTLNAKAATSSWQGEILRAFQTWAMNANINIAVVPDGGQALGVAGAVQGDSRFGDIRIAASPGGLNSVDLADAQPFSWTGTTWSGDVVLNSAQPIGIGNVSGQYDLFSVMLHEAGHVFGLPHDSTDADSVMNETYAYHPQLAAVDIAHLQALYGVRQADTLGNNTLASATQLNTSLQGATAAGDIGSLKDVDYYKIQTPGFLSGISSFAVQVKTSEVSLLMPSLAVYDASGHLVSSVSAPDALHGDITLTVSARPSATYYLRVGNATTSAFGVGSYQLNVANHYWFISLGNVLNIAGTVLNGTLGTALHLNAQNPGTDQRFDYYVQGNQVSSTGAEYYVVQSPANSSNSPENMAAIVWALDVNGLQSRLHVFDANQNPIAAQVIANDSGTYTIQLPNVVPNASYYIEVAAEYPNSSPGSTGRFALAVDFHMPSLVSYANITAGSLTQAQSQAAGMFTANEDELFHFALSGFSSNSNAWVTLTLSQNGVAVLTLRVQAGLPTVTANVFLKKGIYSLSFSGYTSDGSALANVAFQLAGDVISDPVGALSTDPSSSGTSSDLATSSPSTDPNPQTDSSPDYTYANCDPGSFTLTSPSSPPFYY